MISIICWCAASSNLNIRHQWSCGFCNSSIDIQKFTSNEFEYDCFQQFLSFFPVIDLMLLVLYDCLQGTPMFVTTVTIGNFTASCYPQPSHFAAVDLASFQLIQGIQKQGTYQIPPAAPSNQQQNSATETPSGMRHSFMWHFCRMCIFLLHARSDFPYFLTIIACIALWVIIAIGYLHSTDSIIINRFIIIKSMLHSNLIPLYFTPNK